MEVKTVVCLANSIKHGGNCFAGIELVDGWPESWIRPIGTDSGHGVSREERALADGSEPRPLDMVRIGLSAPAPWGHQGENWTLDPSEAWEKTGTWAYDDLEDLVDTPPALWDGRESSSVGIRDRVPVEALVPGGESIYLIRPERAEIQVARNRFGNHDIEVRVEFDYADERHLVKISDPVYKAWYLAEGIGTYELPDAYLTLSLTEPWSKTAGPEHAYVVAAAVIEPDGPP